MAKLIIATLFLYIVHLLLCNGSSSGDGSNSISNSSDYIEDYARYLARFNKSMSRMNEPRRLASFIKNSKLIMAHNSENTDTVSGGSSSSIKSNFILSVNSYTDLLDEEIVSMFPPTIPDHSSIHSYSMVDGEKNNLNRYIRTSDSHLRIQSPFPVEVVERRSSLAESINWATTSNLYGAAFISTIRNQVRTTLCMYMYVCIYATYIRCLCVCIRSNSQYCGHRKLYSTYNVCMYE